MAETPQQAAPPPAADVPPPAGKPAVPPEAPPPKPAEGEAAEPQDERQGQIARKFAQLSREKKQLERQRQEMEAERQRFQSDMARWQETYQSAKKDPDRWLKEGDWTYEKLTDYYKNGGNKPDPLAEVQTLRQELSQLKEQYTAREQAAAKREYMGTIREALSDDPDGRFELVNLYGHHDEVYTYLDELCRRTGRMPDQDDIREAAEAIEEALIEQEEQRYKKAQASQKLARRLGWGAQPNAPADAPEASPEVSKPGRGKSKSKQSLNTTLAPTPAPDDTADLPADSLWEQTVRKRLQRRRG
jgi:hypothetical protein